jgi:glutamine synthetase adenylyltransferase
MENKRVTSAMNQAVHQRNYRRARDRALTRLAQLYPNLYKELLEEEKQRDELEGKRWNSLSDSPVFGVDYTPPNKRHSPTKTGKSRRPRKSSRNYGAKA